MVLAAGRRFARDRGCHRRRGPPPRTVRSDRLGSRPLRAFLRLALSVRSVYAGCQAQARLLCAAAPVRRRRDRLGKRHDGKRQARARHRLRSGREAAQPRILARARRRARADASVPFARAHRVSALALFAGTWRRHGFRASAVKALARTMHRRVLIEGVDDDFPRAPPPRDLAMPHVARYSGFDVFAPYVDRCNRFFGELHRRRFAFHHLDVRTERYNPNGAPGCPDARFPPADGDVDLVSAASLFTHLYPDRARAYAREMA